MIASRRNPTAQTDLNQFIPAGAGGVATEPLVNSLAMDCKTIEFVVRHHYLRRRIPAWRHGGELAHGAVDSFCVN